jgi:hypothetical protein
MKFFLCFLSLLMLITLGGCTVSKDHPQEKPLVQRPDLGTLPDLNLPPPSDYKWQAVFQGINQFNESCFLYFYRLDWQDPLNYRIQVLTLNTPKLYNLKLSSSSPLSFELNGQVEVEGHLHQLNLWYKNDNGSLKPERYNEQFFQNKQEECTGLEITESYPVPY